jgi:hypothetical protein
MKCPKCGEEMKQIACDRFSLDNPMIIAELQTCECGITYQYLEGAERCLDKDGNEIDY